MQSVQLKAEALYGNGENLGNSTSYDIHHQTNNAAYILPTLQKIMVYQE